MISLFGFVNAIVDTKFGLECVRREDKELDGRNGRKGMYSMYGDNQSARATGCMHPGSLAVWLALFVWFPCQSSILADRPGVVNMGGAYDVRWRSPF